MTSGPENAAKRQGPRPWGLRLPQLSFYVLGQLLGPVALLTLLMTSVIWLVQFPTLLDLVITRGQSAPTFLYLTVLVLPQVMVIILPIAFFFGTLFTLFRLNGDSELVVMASAGYSQRQLAVPVFIAAALVMALTYLCTLYLMPAGQRALNDKVLDIRADVAGALLKEGEFSQPSKGLTVFVRSLDSGGQIRDILVHNSLDAKRPVTYIARRGLLAQTPSGARLIMFDGTIERSAAGGAQLSLLTFSSDAINLDQFSGANRPTLRKTSERWLGELFNPPEQNGMTTQIRNGYLAEAHNRLSEPLYCLAFAMIALTTILRGRRQRGPLAVRLTGASLAALAVRIAGYGMTSLAAAHPALNFLLYVIPLLGFGVALAMLMGYSPSLFFHRAQVAT